MNEKLLLEAFLRIESKLDLILQALSDKEKLAELTASLKGSADTIESSLGESHAGT